MDELVLTQKQANWLWEKIWRDFLESDTDDSDGIKIAKRIIMACVPKAKGGEHAA